MFQVFCIEAVDRTLRDLRVEDEIELCEHVFDASSIDFPSYTITSQEKLKLQ